MWRLSPVPGGDALLPTRHPTFQALPGPRPPGKAGRRGDNRAAAAAPDPPTTPAAATGQWTRRGGPWGQPEGLAGAAAAPSPAFQETHP